LATKEFLLPDLGEGLTEAEIVKWLVAVGDTVQVDQPVAEVETAKAVVEVPSPFAGRVATLFAEVGGEVQVGTPLLSVEVADDTRAMSMVPDPLETVDDGDQGTVVEEGGSGSVLVGYGTGGPARRRRRRTPAGNGSAGPAIVRPLAKPPVRKLAKDLGVDLAAVTGSGPGGVITRDDVQAAARSSEPVPLRPPSVVVTAPEGEPLGSAPPNVVAARATEERIAVRGVRRAISEKMTRSRREIPEATTWVDCDGTALLDLRDDLVARAPDVRVTPFAIVLRICVAGLREYPMLNARLDPETSEIVVPRGVHLGFAAQTDRGLVVPVIRDADRRSTLDMARELTRLAVAARDATITPADLTGGTFTASNYGAFGVDGGSAIINHPEAAILGVGRFADKPWVVGGALAVRKVVQLSIAFDHRICDGAEAAGFLRFIADAIEDPAALLASL
jgi:pyruvate dehydrogenase E2 component (dihydrolipoamide acetyltransferase)